MVTNTGFYPRGPESIVPSSMPKGVRELATAEEEINFVRTVLLSECKDLLKFFDEEDLIQVGLTALQKARTRFEPELGNKFITYAKKVVWGALRDMPRNKYLMSRGLYKKKKALEEAESRLSQELQIEAVPSEKLAEALGISMQELNHLRFELACASEPEELETVLSKKREEMAKVPEGLVDYGASAHDQLYQKEQSGVLQKALEVLTKQEKQIAQAIFLNETKITAREVAKEHGVTEGYISQLIKLVLKKMEKYGKDHGLRDN